MDSFTTVFKSGRGGPRRRVRRRKKWGQRDAVLLVLKAKKGAKGCEWLLETLKGKEIDSPLELLEGMPPY